MVAGGVFFQVTRLLGSEINEEMAAAENNAATISKYLALSYGCAISNHPPVPPTRASNLSVHQVQGCGCFDQPEQ